MKYRRLDSNGDMTFGQGKYNYLVDKEAVGQAILTKLKLLENEYWEDIEDGTPLFQKILTQKATAEGINAIDIIIKTRILEVPRVVAISNFKSRVEDRRYFAELDVETEYGDLDGFQVEF